MGTHTIGHTHTVANHDHSFDHSHTQSHTHSIADHDHTMAHTHGMSHTHDFTDDNTVPNSAQTTDRDCNGSPDWTVWTGSTSDSTTRTTGDSSNANTAPRVQLPPRRAVQATRDRTRTPLERKAGLQALTAPKRRPGKARRIRAAIRGLRVIMVPRRLQQQAPAQERRRSTHPRRDLGAVRLMTSILTQNPSR